MTATPRPRHTPTWYIDHACTADRRIVLVVVDEQATVLAHRTVDSLTPQALAGTLRQVLASHPAPQQVSVDHGHHLYDSLERLSARYGIALTHPLAGAPTFKSPAERVLRRLHAGAAPADL
jgi:hypothetical protein